MGARTETIWNELPKVNISSLLYDSMLNPRYNVKLKPKPIQPLIIGECLPDHKIRTLVKLNSVEEQELVAVGSRFSSFYRCCEGHPLGKLRTGLSNRQGIVVDQVKLSS